MVTIQWYVKRNTAFVNREWSIENKNSNAP